MPDDEPIRMTLERLERKIDALAARGVTLRHVIFPMREIARVCGVSERTAYRWTKQALHPLKVVHLNRLGLGTTLSLIDQFLESRYLEEQAGPSKWARSPRSHKWQKGESGNPSGQGRQSTP
ncbi:helix-turn-helix domain-containing protein [Candidatus Methylomirabilis sp.]|uniref:helix-turn-helix domain-containing protein n=1 Tax=Candidatus Methylomirabilis sp. TaxID=2032687 RepID=UPI003075F124